MSLVPYVHPRKSVPRRSSATAVHQIYPFSSPMKGLDVTSGLPNGDPLTALRLENLIPRVAGCELRSGYQRWCSNMGNEVRTLMTFQPATDDAEFFAAADDGSVYDITNQLASGVTPPVVFTDLGGLVDGQWSYTNFTTAAGVHYLVAVCAGAGMYVYDGATWTEITAGVGAMQIDGVNPEEFDFVMIWKSRLWFIQNETTVAWYLPVGVIAGVATPFDFGSLLPHGGALAALTNWTVDGGNGIDDQLVIISTMGDVLIYQGTDPDEASTFQQVGLWYIGRVPTGRRFASQYSQDIVIISERGMCFLSELLRGQGFFANAVIANNINSALATEVATYINQRYWEVRFCPREQLIIINRPATPSGNYQWCYEVNNKAFATLTNLPMITVDVHVGRTYFGSNTDDYGGTVEFAFEGNADGTVDDVPGTDLQGICVTAFTPVGEAVRVKRFLMVRPSFIAPSSPAFQARLNPDWIFSLPGGAPSYVAAGSSLWDSGLWDTAVWSGESNAYQRWIGATGVGRYASLAMRVRGEAGTTFIGWQALVEPGGIL